MFMEKMARAKKTRGLGRIRGQHHPKNECLSQTPLNDRSKRLKDAIPPNRLLHLLFDRCDRLSRNEEQLLVVVLLERHVGCLDRLHPTMAVLRVLHRRRVGEEFVAGDDRVVG